MRLLAILLLLCAAPAGSPARAATYIGVTLPDTYQVGGQTLVLNGMGLRTITIFNVRLYVAGLYLPQQSHDGPAILASTGPKVLILHFLRAGSKELVEKEYRAGMVQNCGDGGCDPADKPDFDRLVAAAPAVEVGDTATYIITGRSVRVLANQRLLGDFGKAELALDILKGFIGARPPTEDLKKGLLGLF